MLIWLLSAVITAVLALGGLAAWAILYALGSRRHGRRIIRWAALAWLVMLPLTLFVLLPVGLSHLLANSSTRPQDVAISRTPGGWGQRFEEVSFPSRDGVRLRGWFLPGEPGRPGIVLSHGLFRSRQEMLERAVAFNQARFPVLLFDFRSHGASEKRAISLGFHERLDVIAASEALREKTASHRVVLLGVSMGAVASIQAAAELHPAPEALIADSPFQSLKETVSRHARLLLGLPAFPFADSFLWSFRRIHRFESSQLDCLEALKKLRQTPVLFIYGGDDRRIPLDVGRTLMTAVADPRRRMLVVEGATHGAAYRENPGRYMSSIFSFLQDISRGD